MDVSQSGPTGPPYRSFESLRHDAVFVRFSPAAERLFWPLEGDFPTTISVMKTPRGANELEPFFTNGAWHEIAHLSVTEPKVSSVEVSVHALEQWEFDWMAWHKDHDSPEFGQEFVTYAELDDDVRPYASEPDEDEDWEDDDDKEFLVACCGEDRPLRKKGIKLVVKASETFVTVQDYLGAVHPWLMSLREDILNAKAVARPQPYPVSDTIKWMVDSWGPQHKIEEKQEWLDMHGGGPPLDLSSLPQSILERMRAGGKNVVI